MKDRYILNYFCILYVRIINRDKSIKKIAKIALVVILIAVSIPTVALLFLDNRQVQTSLSEYISARLAENLHTNISLATVNYSFFKRLQINELFIQDQAGDTLIYSELCNIQFKRFRPDKKLIHIRKLSLENAFLRVYSDENRHSSVQFLVNALKKNLPSEEKTVLIIDHIEFLNSRYRQIASLNKYRGYGMDFSDLYLQNLNIQIKNFVSRLDTTRLTIKNASGSESTGFELKSVRFDLMTHPKFITFSDLRVITPLSYADIPQMDFRFNDSKNFRYLFDSVQVHISSNNSRMDFMDVANFFPEVKDLSGQFILNGSVWGRFGDLFGENVKIDYQDQTVLHFDMRLKGLPSADSLYLDFDFHEFNSTPGDLKKLTLIYDPALLRDSTKFTGLEKFIYRGSFRGYKNDFETTGNIVTNLGDFEIDLNMKPDTSRILHFKGSVASGGFNLGKLIQNEPDIGTINFNLQVDGRNNNGALNANISGLIDTLGLYGYNYSNIELTGNLSNRKFDGSMSIRDPNIALNFTGNIDFEEEIPVFDFTADVSNLRPYYLHLRKDDPEYFASFFLKTKMTGKNFSELNGDVQLINSLFRRTGAQVQIYDILLSTINSPDSSFLSLKSDMIDAEIMGKYKLPQLPTLFASLVNDHFEIVPGYPLFPDTSSHFYFKADVKNINPLMDFFLPKFSIAKGIKVEGSFLPSEEDYWFECKGSFPFFKFNDLSWENLGFEISSDTSQFTVSLDGDRLLLSEEFQVEKPLVYARFYENKNAISLAWSNNEAPFYAGEINTNGFLEYMTAGDYSYALNIEPSRVRYKNKTYDIPSSTLNINSSGIAIDSLLIQGADQFFLADGRYTKNPQDSLTLSLTNFNLRLVNAMLPNLPVDIGGSLSGNTSFKQEAGKPMFTSNMLIAGLMLNQEEMGFTSIRTDWNRRQEQLEFQIQTISDQDNQVNANGYYRIRNDNIDVDVRLNEVNLRIIEPYFTGLVKEVKGNADAVFALDGTLSKPMLNGTAYINDASMIVSGTNCRYRFSDTLRLYKNDLYFDHFDLKDEYDNRMVVRGNISTSNFRKLFVNLNLSSDNFNFLATTRFDNEQFYGDIYASAIADVTGPIDQMNIRVKASTERFTNLKLPLYNAARIQTTDFITFIRAEEDDLPVLPPDPETKKTYRLDMDLDIRSNTSVQLIFDPKVGDIIEASGNGTLKIEIDESGEFNMFGDVLINDGEYLFTLQNVINKRFRVKPGGTISWNGSPTSAIINLEAIYETKASTYSLAPVPTEDMKKRIPVQCLLSLQGDLSNPTIVPSIELPTADPKTRSLVETSIGTEEDLLRQFISLLVINNFISNADIGTNPLAGGSSGMAAGVTASELLSNQLSNWLSQISNDFDIGVNYRPGDAISSDEVEVALSTQLLNDRIIFTGNLDVLSEQVTSPSGEASNIVGDFDIEFRVSEKISLKAFNRVNDDRVIRPSLYTQGVGLLYRSEFNNMSDLFGRNRSKRSEKNGSSTSSQKGILRDEEQPSILR